VVELHNIVFTESLGIFSSLKQGIELLSLSLDNMLML